MKVFEDSSKHMEQISTDGQELLSQVVQVIGEVSGVDQLCNEMIRVDVSSQEEPVEMNKMKAEDDGFTGIPQGSTYFTQGGCGKFLQQKSSIDGLYHTKLISLPNESIMQLGGSMDPDCA